MRTDAPPGPVFKLTTFGTGWKDNPYGQSATCWLRINCSRLYHTSGCKRKLRLRWELFYHKTLIPSILSPATLHQLWLRRCSTFVPYTARIPLFWRWKTCKFFLTMGKPTLRRCPPLTLKFPLFSWKKEAVPQEPRHSSSPESPKNRLHNSMRNKHLQRVIHIFHSVFHTIKPLSSQ